MLSPMPRPAPEWPTCAHCGAPISTNAERAAADVETMFHIRNTHCLRCFNLAVCGAACEKCGHIPGGAQCEMEW
jgi:hypothetical protein